MNNVIFRNLNPISLSSDLDRVMDAVFGNLDPVAGRSLSRVPAVDVVEEDTRYLVTADIPGFGENEVEIKIDDQLLTISGKSAEDRTEASEKSEKDEKASKPASKWLVRERRSAAFCRSFTLPRDADRESIKASVSNGVLRIEVAKVAKAQPRTIEIKRG